MRIVRIPAFQGHAIPSKAGYPVGPFNPEVLAPSQIVVDEGEPQFPYGATSQNGFQGLKLYRCTYCGDTVTEEEIDAHYCTAEG
jgi:hypothetical protein